MAHPITIKSDLLFSLRNALHAAQFVEVVTPVARKANIGAGRRAPVDLGDGRFLRTMIGPALRVNLEFHKRIFEIGPCFRPDKPDELHSPEFTMLDLYVAHESFDYLIDLAYELVTPHIRHTPARLSISDHIRDLFGIDLRREPLGDLPTRMASHMRLSSQIPFKTVLGQFVEQELETKSTGTALLLTDYPMGGDEPCARLTPGTTAILNRFELLVDGIEVVHGYEDECDAETFAERARAVDLYDAEQALAWEAISTGRVPATSVGMGIGIERLCMAATGVRDIGKFLQSPQF